jgi:hypothetical protein
LCCNTAWSPPLPLPLPPSRSVATGSIKQFKTQQARQGAMLHCRTHLVILSLTAEITRRRSSKSVCAHAAWLLRMPTACGALAPKCKRTAVYTDWRSASVNALRLQVQNRKGALRALVTKHSARNTKSKAPISLPWFSPGTKLTARASWPLICEIRQLVRVHTDKLARGQPPTTLS